MKINTPKTRFKKSNGSNYPDWEEKKLGEIGKITTGKTPSTLCRDLWVGDILFVTPTDIIVGQKYQNQTKRRVKNNSNNILPSGSILYTCIASIGKMSISTKPCITNQQINSLAVSNNHDKEFVYYALLFRTPEIQATQANTTLPIINKTEFSKIRIEMPCDKEQQKIANFLTVVDEKIENLQNKKEQFEKYKKVMMQKIFPSKGGQVPKIRFKKSDGSNYPNWEEKKISDMFKITRGNVLANNKIRKNQDAIYKYPIYSSQTINNGLWGYYNNYLFENSITWTTDGANAGNVNFRSGKFYCTNVCGVLKSEDGYANPCLAEILNRNTRKYVSYVGNPKLMNNVMGIIKITVPKSIEEQKIISEFLTSLDNKVDLINQKLEQTKLFKKSLLQQMFI